jgi:hypothetical protein
LTELARVLRADLDLRDRIARTQGNAEFVLASFTGGLADGEGFNREMVSGGHSRVLHVASGAVTPTSGGGLVVTGGRFVTYAPPLPGPEDVLVYAMANEALGTHGQFFPCDAEDAHDMHLSSQALSPLRQQYYLRKAVQMHGGVVSGSRYEPYVSPWAGSRTQPWFVDGHGTTEGLAFALRTDRPLHFGDVVILNGVVSGKLIAVMNFHRQARSDGMEVVVLAQCRLNQRVAGTTSTQADQFGQGYAQLGREDALFGATEVVSVVSSNGVRILQGPRSAFTEVSPKAEPLSPDVPLADLAANDIKPVHLTFPPYGTTIRGAEAGSVREAARRVARAAAWRKRKRVGMPEVAFTGFGKGLLDGWDVVATGQRRADAAVELFLHELTTEAARLRRLGLDTTPEDVVIRVRGAQAPKGVDRGVLIEFRLPRHELGGRQVERIALGPTDDAVAELDEAFAELAPFWSAGRGTGQVESALADRTPAPTESEGMQSSALNGELQPDAGEQQ